MKITKTLIILSILLMTNSCYSQRRADKNKLEIIFPEAVNMVMVKTGQDMVIINKSNETYIIDPYSFTVNVKVIENDKEIQPYRQKLFGSYGRDINDCKETVLIVKPKEKIKTKVFFFPLDYYNFSTDKKYILKSMASYNRNSLIGCNEYINQLEKKKYKIPDIQLNVTSKLILN
ncbi:hypothetical protein CHRYSEOSP005_24700 [Chryseobacterium sp. Alg-005]|uniref:hypothetical protein n=1 Tax=Chryseobacterium sp. Alg-005 TaxID=3159516 RepID=UPI00355595DC